MGLLQLVASFSSGAVQGYYSVHGAKMLYRDMCREQFFRPFPVILLSDFIIVQRNKKAGPVY